MNNQYYDKMTKLHFMSNSVNIKLANLQPTKSSLGELDKVGRRKHYKSWYTGLILGFHPAKEMRYYFVTTSLIGWAHA